MKKSPKLLSLAAVSGVLAMGLLIGNVAHASCGSAPSAGNKHSGVRLDPQFRPAGLVETSFEEGWEQGSIVGLWEFEVHLKGAQNDLPDNFLFDWGLATWHEDGSEIQFSAARPPSSGDVCMGVWKQVGRGTFDLNHIALGLDLKTGKFVGPANIRAKVKVDRSGDSYSGTYTLTQYSGSPDNGTEVDLTKPVATFVATVTAKRVSADD
jgi:hypothetical protein